MNWKCIVNEMPRLFKELKQAPLVIRSKVNSSFPFLGGIYVFYEKGRPLYVGRTKRPISKRVLMHSRGCSGQNSASFAFLLAKRMFLKGKDSCKKTRKSLIADKKFAKIFYQQKRRIREMEVRCVQITDPEVQAIFEIYASKHLNTPYNDFNTH